MNTKNLFFIAAALGLLTTSCTNTATDATQTTVQSDITQTVANVTASVNTLTSSPGYDVLATSTQDLSTVTPLGFKVKAETAILSVDSFSIAMADIAGTYELTKSTLLTSLTSPTKYMISYFNKDSITPNNAMVLLLPSRRLSNLKVLLADTLALKTKNDIKVTVSDYHRNVNLTTGKHDYSMTSTISKNGSQTGIYKVSRTGTGTTSTINANTINNEFDFVSGHVAKYSLVKSDTAATSTYTLTDGTKTLFQEQFWSTKLAKSLKYTEKQYSLTFGNVKLVRKPLQTLDSAQIYLNNVLQTKAKITITKTVAFANDSTENGIANGRRAIVVTFDDGSTANITTLTGAATMNRLRDLFDNLRKSYFGSYLVDQAAINISKLNQFKK